MTLAPPAAAPAAPAPAYHLQFRSAPGHRWFKPVLVLLIAGGLLVLFQVGLLATLSLVPIGTPYGPSILAVESDLAFLESANSPLGLLFLLLSVILMWPATSAAMALIYGRSVSVNLLSVYRRLRWRRLGVYTGIAVVLFAILSAVDLAIYGSFTPWLDPTSLLMLGIVLVLVPFQATAEEVVFRGLLMNSVGSWLRHPAWAILLPVPLFVFGHVYDAVGLASIAVFAVATGYLAVRTRGLEAPIALHVINNLSSFGIAILAGADLDATEVDPVSALISSAVVVVFVGAVEAVEALRRRRLAAA